MEPKDWVATLLAFVAIAISVWTVHAGHKQERLTAIPHLHITERFSPSSERHGLELYNFGLGLALVDGFQIYYRNEALTGDWSAQWKTFEQRTDLGDCATHGAVLPGEPIAVNVEQPAEILLIVDEAKEWRKNNAIKWDDCTKRVRTAINALTISIWYHSVYGETFEISKSGLTPEYFRQRSWYGTWYAWSQ